MNDVLAATGTGAAEALRARLLPVGSEGRLG